MPKPITSTLTSALTRRDLARQALAGAAGALLAALALPARSQTVDPAPAAPPLPTAPQNSTRNTTSMPNTTQTEGQLLTELVPVAAGYALSETQAKEAAAQLKDYPGGFAKARAYALPDDIGPAFAADAPVRKERAK